AITMLVKPLWPLMEYVANYDYIVEVLCENRDRPQLNCDGKCYLAKQLAKEQNDRGENPFGEQRSKVEFQPLVYFEALTDYDGLFDLPLADRDDPHHLGEIQGMLRTGEIDHPPKLP